MTKYVFFHADSLMSISSEMLKWSQKYSNRTLIAKKTNIYHFHTRIILKVKFIN